MLADPAQSRALGKRALGERRAITHNPRRGCRRSRRARARHARAPSVRPGVVLRPRIVRVRVRAAERGRPVPRSQTEPRRTRRCAHPVRAFAGRRRVARTRGIGPGRKVAPLDRLRDARFGRGVGARVAHADRSRAGRLRGRQHTGFRVRRVQSAASFAESSGAPSSGHATPTLGSFQRIPNSCAGS